MTSLHKDILLADDVIRDARQGTEYLHQTTLGKIADINYAIINKGIAKHPIYKFKTLKSYFPNLQSTREFITADNYLGNIRIDIRSRFEKPPIAILNSAVSVVLSKVAEAVSGIEETYEGTKEFMAKHVHDIFSDKTVNYTVLHDGGRGISQNDASVGTHNRIDLSREDWFVFSDNYGTSEEKAFVAYFKNFAETLKAKYSKVFLVRNERQFHLYSFAGGERFEPDYVLFLQKDKVDGYEQLQIFIEPKGSHLVDKDKWKEDFLLQMKDSAVPIKVFADDNNYLIWGFHFFNTKLRRIEFDAEFQQLTTP